MGVFPKIKTNNSTYLSKTKCEEGHHWWVSFEFYPIAVGETATVFEGRMYNEHGYWSQSKSTVKTLNNDIGSEENLKSVVDVSQKARSLAQNFHREFLNSKTLNFVMPCIAEMDSISVFNTPFRYLKGYEKELAEHEHVIIEEFIEGDIKTFVDHNGKACEESELLNAFVHYTYVESNGDLVLCNFEGRENHTNFKLSTLLAHSRNRSFGSRDQGEHGILNVFKNHQCNNICKNWPTPSFGIVPTAPIFTESKDNMYPNCTKGFPVFVNQTFLMDPPSYEQSALLYTKTEDRPLVHRH